MPDEKVNIPLKPLRVTLDKGTVDVEKLDHRLRNIEIVNKLMGKDQDSTAVINDSVWLGDGLIDAINEKIFKIPIYDYRGEFGEAYCSRFDSTLCYDGNSCPCDKCTPVPSNNGVQPGMIVPIGLDPVKQVFNRLFKTSPSIEGIRAQQVVECVINASRPVYQTMQPMYEPEKPGLLAGIANFLRGKKSE